MEGQPPLPSTPKEAIEKRDMKYTYIIRKVTDEFSGPLCLEYAICKIGNSKNPPERLKKLQTGNDCQLELIAFIPLAQFENPLRDHYNENATYPRSGEWVAIPINEYGRLVHLFERFFDEQLRFNFGPECFRIRNEELIPLCIGARKLSKYNQGIIDQFEKAFHLRLTDISGLVRVAGLIYTTLITIATSDEPDHSSDDSSTHDDESHDNNAPIPVRANTDNNHLVDFLKQYIIADEEYLTEIRHFQSKYIDYCTRLGIAPLSRSELETKIEGLGFPFHHAHGSFRGFAGLIFKEDMAKPQSSWDKEKVRRKKATRKKEGKKKITEFHVKLWSKHSFSRK